MTAKLRPTVWALVVSLLIVPAMLRATRVFDRSDRASIAPSVGKSVDVPPDPAEVPPDVAVAPVVMVPVHLLEGPAVASDAPVFLIGDTPRGPPARFLS